MPLDEQLSHLQGLAEGALGLWDLPEGTTVRLINVSENCTYLVEAPEGRKSVLRVHRAGYHSRRAIECELAWLDALGTDETVMTSGYSLGKNGAAIQSASAPGLPEPRHLVMFRFVEGAAPDESSDLIPNFQTLGTIAARCHQHVMGWQKPGNFQRLTWDLDAVFGATPTWGDWRKAPHVTPGIRDVLERVEAKIRTRLDAYGKSRDRFDLIHADMRLANLLVDRDRTCLIDFDDCGFGWFMYDFAAAISFIEDDPRIPELKTAWLTGYRRVRPLSLEDETEIDTFIMLRRMALLAWIGSHIEAPEPQALAPKFAATTAQLGQAWLDGMAG